MPKCGSQCAEMVDHLENYMNQVVHKIAKNASSLRQAATFV
jgi:hypothetical protein